MEWGEDDDVEDDGVDKEEEEVVVVVVGTENGNHPEELEDELKAA